MHLIVRKLSSKEGFSHSNHWTMQTVKNMENNKSLLRTNEIHISDDITIKIPTVGEILDDEEYYYSITNQITASPYSMMVQLHDNGVDFTQITDYELFLMFSHSVFSRDLSIIFGDTFLELYKFLSDNDIAQEEKDKALIFVKNQENDDICLYDREDDVLIDEYIYEKISNALRKINLTKKDNRKAGNNAAKEYLIEKNRRYQNRHKNDEYKPILENLVIALVNKQEFKYNYEETMNMTIYNFNRSVKQIQHTVNFDKTMIGVYAGTIDTSKITDKSIFSFIEN